MLWCHVTQGFSGSEAVDTEDTFDCEEDFPSEPVLVVPVSSGVTSPEEQVMPALLQPQEVALPFSDSKGDSSEIIEESWAALSCQSQWLPNKIPTTRGEAGYSVEAAVQLRLNLTLLVVGAAFKTVLSNFQSM